MEEFLTWRLGNAVPGRVPSNGRRALRRDRWRGLAQPSRVAAGGLDVCGHWRIARIELLHRRAPLGRTDTISSVAQPVIVNRPVFTRDLPADLLEPPINVLRASLHPRGLASRIVNLAEWRAHLLHRLQRQVALAGDADLTALYDESRAYPSPPRAHAAPEHSAVVVPLRLRVAERELSLFSMVASIDTPLESPFRNWWSSRS